jgi:hypothetical protein
LLTRLIRCGAVSVHHGIVTDLLLLLLGVHAGIGKTGEEQVGDAGD